MKVVKPKLKLCHAERTTSGMQNYQLFFKTEYHSMKWGSGGIAPRFL